MQRLVSAGSGSTALVSRRETVLIQVCISMLKQGRSNSRDITPVPDLTIK